MHSPKSPEALYLQFRLIWHQQTSNYTNDVSNEASEILLISTRQLLVTTGLLEAKEIQFCSQNSRHIGMSRHPKQIFESPYKLVPCLQCKRGRHILDLVIKKPAKM